MSTILVIQPYKMLQHAIALSLFPQYQVRMTAVIPASDEFEDVDAVIIDAASLRETHGLTGEAMALLRDWEVPMVWIDNGDSSLVPPRGKLLIVAERPIGRQSLQKAVAECLEESAKTTGKKSAPAREEGECPKAEPVVAEKGAQADVIDLVDVVHEAPERKEI